MRGRRDEREEWIKEKKGDNASQDACMSTHMIGDNLSPKTVPKCPQTHLIREHEIRLMEDPKPAARNELLAGAKAKFRRAIKAMLSARESLSAQLQAEKDDLRNLYDELLSTVRALDEAAGNHDHEMEESTVLYLEDLPDILQPMGLSEDNPLMQKSMERLEPYVTMHRGEDALEFDNFYRFMMTVDNNDLLYRALTGGLSVPNFEDFCKDCVDVLESVRSDRSGENADYIPELKNAPSEYLGLAICTVDGQVFSYGDTTVGFSIQSCHKPFNYALALEEHGPDTVHKYVGTEPSGAEFNAFKLLGKGKTKRPHNPMINAGAIISSSLIQKKLPLTDRYAYVSGKFAKIAGVKKLGFENTVYLSERATADRNYALGYFMRGSRVFRHSDDPNHFKESLDLYLQSCSVQVTCTQLASMAATFANRGTCAITREECFSPETVRHVLSIMFAAGMYDWSGSWTSRIGLPAKSGVAGGLYAVVPNVMGICVFSPRLDERGNSVRGVKFFKNLAERFPLGVFDQLLSTDKGFAADHKFISADKSLADVIRSRGTSGDHRLVPVDKTLNSVIRTRPTTDGPAAPDALGHVTKERTITFNTVATYAGGAGDAVEQVALVNVPEWQASDEDSDSDDHDSFLDRSSVEMSISVSMSAHEDSDGEVDGDATLLRLQEITADVLAQHNNAHGSFSAADSTGHGDRHNDDTLSTAMSMARRKKRKKRLKHSHSALVHHNDGMFKAISAASVKRDSVSASLSPKLQVGMPSYLVHGLSRLREEYEEEYGSRREKGTSRSSRRSKKSRSAKKTDGAGPEPAWAKKLSELRRDQVSRDMKAHNMHHQRHRTPTPGSISPRANVASNGVENSERATSPAAFLAPPDVHSLLQDAGSLQPKSALLEEEFDEDLHKEDVRLAELMLEKGRISRPDEIEEDEEDDFTGFYDGDATATDDDGDTDGDADGDTDGDADGDAGGKTSLENGVDQDGMRRRLNMQWSSGNLMEGINTTAESSPNSSQPHSPTASISSTSSLDRSFSKVYVPDEQERRVLKKQEARVGGTGGGRTKLKKSGSKSKITSKTKAKVASTSRPSSKLNLASDDVLMSSAGSTSSGSTTKTKTKTKVKAKPRPKTASGTPTKSAGSTPPSSGSASSSASATPKKKVVKKKKPGTAENGTM